MEPFCVVGIDVSKAQLDVYVLPQTTTMVVPNTREGLELLLQRVKQWSASLVVFEATGGYERSLLVALAREKLPAFVANPRQVRDFVRGAGQRAKTDRIDARMLAQFGLTHRPQPRPLPTEASQALEALLDRRRQLHQILEGERSRLEHATTNKVRTSLEEHIEWLRNQLSKTDDDLDELLKEHEDFRGKEVQLRVCQVWEE